MSYKSKYTGLEVDRRLSETDKIKTKIAATYFHSIDMKLYGFASIEDREEYLATGNTSLIIDECPVNLTGTQNRINILDKQGTTTLYFTTNANEANITVGFESQEKGITDTEWKEISEDFVVSVSVDRGAMGSYETFITDKQVLNGNTLTFDVRRYLATGSNRIKVTAKGVDSGAVANLTYQVTLTSMYLEAPKFDWGTPFIEGNKYQLGGMNIGGNLDKTLFIKVSNERGYSHTYEVALGMAQYTSNAYFFGDMEFPSGGTGVYNVEIWVQSGTLETVHLSYNIICIAKGDEYTAELVAIADVAPKIINYAQNKLFSYVVYSKGNPSATPELTITALINQNPTSIEPNLKLHDVPTGKINEYSRLIEIVSAEANIAVTANIKIGDCAQEAVYSVDNSASYPATAGAVFYMNSATRKNSDENREKIVNIATKSEITATWTKCAFTEGVDGHSEDELGRRCLVLPAHTKCVIDYEPFATFNTKTGKTIEIMLKARNVADYNEPIVTICDDASKADFKGLKITPTNILLHSNDLRILDLRQGINVKDEEIVHIIITITKNYKVNYGNIVKIFINGSVAREFEFSNADTFEIQGGKIELGSDSADSYIYPIRVYEKSFGKEDAENNYTASMRTPEEKQIMWELLNSVRDSLGNIDYDKVSKRLNTCAIEMLNGAELPHKGLSKEYSAYCNVYFSFYSLPNELREKAWEFVLLNCLIQGQGTTSMNYFLWNLRWRIDKSGSIVIEYPDGTEQTFEGVWFFGENNGEMMQRITSKKNYASGSQAHKMGATAAFNDVMKHLAKQEKYADLINEINSPVAVRQIPVYTFSRVKKEGTELYSHNFIGLYTIGADKGDKNYFGFNKPEVKDTVIRLEGTDHIKGVGFNYPYEVNGVRKIRYNADKEALCIVNGTDRTRWTAILEQSATGNKKTEAEIDEYLAQEFKPAYECVYNNNPLILGVSGVTIDEINADVTSFGLLRSTTGRPYSHYEFYIDGEYDLYYLNKETNKYEKNGINLYGELNAEQRAKVDAATNVADKDVIFIANRIGRFRLDAPNYFCINDALYQTNFLYNIGASDNFEKNMYPYKLQLLKNGSRWRFLQDDLDSIFSSDNQAQDTKKYSIELHDFTDNEQSAYVFKGEDSAFFQLIELAYPDEMKQMGKDILQAMYEMSPYGSKTLDKLTGFFQFYFFDQAQEYFTKSAYNNDVEISYEDAWADKKYVAEVDIHPLAQAVGDHYTTERAWIERRMLYLMSKYNFGSYGNYEDSSLGIISVRTQEPASFTLTPAIDSYPTILGGQGEISSAVERVFAGEEWKSNAVGGSNTNVYIVGADWLSDIGDLKDLKIDKASAVMLSISSKRLRRVKVGDENAEEVTSYLATLSIQQCESLESVDARNLTTLIGDVDLSKCPRLIEALFEGTNVSQVIIAAGSKIEKLHLPDSVSSIDLRETKYLNDFAVGELTNIRFMRLEYVPTINAFAMLKEAYNTNNHALKHIRLLGFTYNGDATDIDMLADLATATNESGAKRYTGIDANGNETTGNPIIKGTLNVDGYVYEETANVVKAQYPSIIFTPKGYYIRFADPEVQRICAENWGDGVGITKAQVEAVTDIGTVFKGNTTIESFDEFGKFVNAQAIPESAFSGCLALNSIDLSKVISLSHASFYNSGLTEIISLGEITSIPYRHNYNEIGCFTNSIKLTKVVLPDTLKNIGNYAFQNCPITEINLPQSLEIINSQALCSVKAPMVVDLPNLTTLGQASFWASSVVKVLNLGTITKLQGNNDYNSFGDFYNCKNLEIVITPNTISSIAAYSLRGCSVLNTFVCKATTPPTLGSGSFTGTPIASGAGSIYVPDASVEAYKTATNWSQYSSRIKGVGELPIDNPTLYDEIKDYLEGVVIKEMIIKPNTTNVSQNTLQLTCFYKGEVVTPQWSVEGDATINANGLLTFNSEGEVIITATYNGVSESKTYYYEIVEIVNGVTLESNGNTSASSTMSTVGFVPTKGATTIKWGVTGGTNGLLCEYTDDGTCADYWGASANPRTTTINANSTLVKASFSTEHLANAYIMNATTGEYLWKGENVE